MPKKIISWEEYFMGIALLSSLRSKDPNTQVGACIVNKDKKVIGIGYNGFPNGIHDEKLPWGRENEDINETKYPYVVHAELNAILNSARIPKKCKIYTTCFPCNECTKAIIQSGINELIYLSDIHSGSKSTKASKKLLDLAKIPYRKFKAEKHSEISLFFKTEN